MRYGRYACPAIRPSLSPPPGRTGFTWRPLRLSALLVVSFGRWSHGIGLSRKLQSELAAASMHQSSNQDILQKHDVAIIQTAENNTSLQTVNHPQEAGHSSLCKEPIAMLAMSANAMQLQSWKTALAHEQRSLGEKEEKVSLPLVQGQRATCIRTPGFAGSAGLGAARQEYCRKGARQNSTLAQYLGCALPHYTAPCEITVLQMVLHWRMMQQGMQLGAAI